MKVYRTTSLCLPVFIWIDEIEQSALKQIDNLSSLPFAFHHIAIMPDCHSGYGMPIGGVLATENVIIPNAVGLDIGCGMCAMKTNLKSEQLNKEILKNIITEIRKVIPTGFNHHKEMQDEELMPKRQSYKEKYPIIFREYESALTQIGTLGGGNHFIEIQKDKEDNIWIMIHSGSRNLGKQVADYYNKLAIKLNEKWHTKVPKEYQLAFLPYDSEEGQNYMAEMQYCIDFALANRKLMMSRILKILLNEFCLQDFEISEDKKEKWLINIAHNYASWENHFGKNVIIHRKGATLAREGIIGIIPGSQGSKSYIVEGLGNPRSFNSCSHGAGRIMSRTKAQQTLNLNEEIAIMDSKGIVHGIETTQDLDEAPGAYKNIDEVMENQKDLVKILIELQPLAVVKG